MDDDARDVPAVSPSPTNQAGELSLDQAMQSLLSPVRELLERIESKLDGTAAPDKAESAPTEPAASTSPPKEDPAISAGRRVVHALTKRIEQVESHLDAFREESLAAIERVAESVAPPEEPPELESTLLMKAPLAMDDETWAEIFLGEDICGDETLAPTRQQFIEDVIGGDDSARSLAAMMMLVQSASIDQMPELLQHVGEAYYRWRPCGEDGQDPMEKALAAWLTGLAEAAGLRNSIQLVRPGERFEKSRHVASERGSQIVAVHGWVVLRDGNKVYTRANVSVK